MSAIQQTSSASCLVFEFTHYDTSKTELVMRDSFVILHRATQLYNLTREFYLVYYELVKLTDTSDQ